MGGDFATSSTLFAVHADTGEPAWSFDTISRDPQSWPKEAAKHGGGAAWLPGTYDEESGTIYIGTGNAAPDFDGIDRPGDNKYTATLLALEPETGKIKWYNQEIPHEIWDYDSTFELLRVKRNSREYLVHPNKSGFVFVYNQQGGRPDHVWRMARNITLIGGKNARLPGIPAPFMRPVLSRSHGPSPIADKSRWPCRLCRRPQTHSRRSCLVRAGQPGLS